MTAPGRHTRRAQRRNRHQRLCEDWYAVGRAIGMYDERGLLAGAKIPRRMKKCFAAGYAAARQEAGQ